MSRVWRVLSTKRSAGAGIGASARRRQTSAALFSRLGGRRQFSARVMDGTKIAGEIRSEVKASVDRLRRQHAGAVPGLAVILVGARPDSRAYVAMKKKACAEVGILSFSSELADDCTQAQLLREIERYNHDDNVHGILVQLPLPEHIDEEQVLDRVSIHKDVDGFHAVNVGRLCRKGKTPPAAVACTPAGCLELLVRSGVSLEGAEACVIGRSNIVGMPMAALLKNANATVTVAHRRTRDLPTVVRRADIVVAAIGKAGFIKGDWIKPGATVIDVGINAVPDDTKESGHRLVGDVDYLSASAVAGLLTPVPGGVGPMTIAMLLRNTVQSFQRAIVQLEKAEAAAGARLEES